MTVFIMRHGESVANHNPLEYLTREDRDQPLTEWGYEQAVKAGKALREHYDEDPASRGRKLRIIHSPFLRTSQSTEAFIKGFGRDRIASVESDEALAEIGYGVLRGAAHARAGQPEYAKALAAFEATKHDQAAHYTLAPPEGESREQCAQRMENFANALIKRDDGVTDFMIIGHDVGNHLLEKALLGESREWFYNHGRQLNCEIDRLEGAPGHLHSAQCIHTADERPKRFIYAYKSAPYGVEREPADIVR